MSEMTGAQALVHSLVSEGVDTVFALPGYQLMPAFDAFYEEQGQIEIVHTRHEQATTFMADGYAKATGRIGVAMTVPGPGMLFAAAGLGTAFSSSSPVFLISGQVPSAVLGKRLGHLHEIDEQMDVIRPITKWANRVKAVDEIPFRVHEAVHHLTTGRPRPVELEVPTDILLEKDKVEIMGPELYPTEVPDSRKIEEAAKVLANADRISIIAGGGVLISGASAELTKTAHFLQAPVITTENAKGVIPENHELSAGVHYSGVGYAYELLPESDAVLIVGTRMLLDEYEPFSFSGHQKLIQIDVDSTELGKNYDVEVEIHGDAKQSLLKLLDALQSQIEPRESRGGDIISNYRAFNQKLRSGAEIQSGMVDAIRTALPDDSIVVSGMTNIGYWSHLLYEVRRPRSYLTPGYFGTLGFAFPTALGAKIGRPEVPVVALCGDGGFMYGATELSTAVRYGINVVAVVFNNGAYGASRWDQQTRFRGRYLGTDLHNPDFVKLAESFGAVGLKTNPDGLANSILEAVDLKAPVLLEVETPLMAPPFD